MSKRKKRHDPHLKIREQAHKVASQYLLAGVSDLDGAVFLFNKDTMEHIRISKSTAAMINDVKHHWSMVCCVAGRYKNGKVWVRYDQGTSTTQATAHEISPLITEFVDDFFNAQDENTRLCKWWMATANIDYKFTAEEIITPAYKVDVFRAFINKNEVESGVDYGNHPPKLPNELTLGEFKEWWDANRSPRSQLKELWVEE